MRLNETETRRRFAESRVARLCTVAADGTPHLVPVTFAVSGSFIHIAIDAKPKQTRDLRRLRNIAENPAVCLLTDHYAEDWTQLWWSRADGIATIQHGDDMREPIDLLVARYSQYRQNRPEGPVISVAVQRWSGWSAHSQE
jgi:PPOX class probable F420-dependent enzyme